MSRHMLPRRAQVIWALSCHGYLLTEAVTPAAVGQIIQESLLKTCDEPLAER